MLLPHQTRVVAEYNELLLKADALNNFVVTDIFDKLPTIEQSDLSLQLGAMRLYLDKLNSRISRFSGTPLFKES